MGQPSNSDKCSEATDGAACQSEGRTQAFGSTRCTTRCTEKMSCDMPTSAARIQRRRTGVDGRTFEDIEAYGAEQWLGELAEELREKTYQPQAVRRVYHPEAGRQAAALGHPHDPRPRGADGDGAGLGADLRGRPAAGAIRLPAGTQRAWTRCRQVHRLLNNGYTEVVDADLAGYFDSIPHAELMQVGGASGRRSARAASDQDVAGSAGRGNRQAGRTRSERPATRTRDGARRKAHRSRHCWRICICDGSCWAGRSWGTTSGLKRTSSTMPTTS